MHVHVHVHVILDIVASYLGFVDVDWVGLCIFGDKCARRLLSSN